MIKTENGPKFIGDNRWLGNMNCRIASPARSGVGRGAIRFAYDGTTLGLTRNALAVGVKVGAVVVAVDSGKEYCLTATPHDQRAGGFWCCEIPRQ